MTGPAYLCPRCRAPARHEAGPDGPRYLCAGCGAGYPVLCGIPDFRLAPDRYLTLEAERAKAARLHAFARDHDFAETLAEYYRITDDVPPEMARRFAGYVLAGEARGRAVLERLGPGGPLLDAGCGAGGLVAAAARAGQPVCGTDIALRWLVIAAKRLEEAGLSAELVCADIAHPPFPPGRFARVAATDLFEHLPDPPAAAAALCGLLEPGGRIYATGANRYTLAPYPPAGLWGVGMLPPGLRRRYVTFRRGFDTLRHLAPTSPGALARLLRRAGFAQAAAAPMQVPAERAQTLRGAPRRLLPLYRRLCAIRPGAAALLRLGPVFEITARRPGPAPATGSATGKDRI
mgnify:CR=1 FL=1